MKRPGVILPLPGWDASPLQGSPQYQFCQDPFTHLGGERHCKSKGPVLPKNTTQCPQNEFHLANPAHSIRRRELEHIIIIKRNSIVIFRWANFKVLNTSWSNVSSPKSEENLRGRCFRIDKNTSHFRHWKKVSYGFPKVMRLRPKVFGEWTKINKFENTQFTLEWANRKPYSTA